MTDRVRQNKRQAVVIDPERLELLLHQERTPAKSSDVPMGKLCKICKLRAKGCKERDISPRTHSKHGFDPMTQAEEDQYVRAGQDRYEKAMFRLEHPDQ